jgi:hypothetical protein
VISLIVITPVSVNSGHQQENNIDQSTVGLPFVLKEERTSVGLGKTTWWMVSLILPRDYYSRENLERIFQYYSEKHPNKKSILRVNVYADEETYQRYVRTFCCAITADPPKEENDTQARHSSKETWSIAHATYERLCYNEFYYYSPDLENPDKRETVVLKGKTQTLTFIPSDCQ